MTALAPRPLGPGHDQGRTPVRAAATRRQFLGMVAAAGFLAACGSDDGDEAVASDTTAPAGTRSVTNQFGTFEVPLEPERVVVLEGRRDLETVLAVGLEPIAIGSNGLDEDGQVPAFLGWEPPDEVVVLENFDVNVEQVVALRPDLIVSRDSNISDAVEQLIELAPLVPVASGDDGSWREDLLAVAEVLGRTEQAEAAVAVYDERLAEVQERHGDRIGSAIVAVVQAGGTLLYASRLDGFYLQNRTLGDLGGQPVPAFEELELADGYVELSLERLDVLEVADAVLLIATDEERTELEANPLWPLVPAVAAGRVVQTDFRTNYGSVFAAAECLNLLDQVYDTLA
jgi:iron complex transport system substrate-binding protein